MCCFFLMLLYKNSASICCFDVFYLQQLLTYIGHVLPIVHKECKFPLEDTIVGIKDDVSQRGVVLNHVGDGVKRASSVNALDIYRSLEFPCIVEVPPCCYNVVAEACL